MEKQKAYLIMARYFDDDCGRTMSQSIGVCLSEDVAKDKVKELTETVKRRNEIRKKIEAFQTQWHNENKFPDLESLTPKVKHPNLHGIKKHQMTQEMKDEVERVRLENEKIKNINEEISTRNHNKTSHYFHKKQADLRNYLITSVLMSKEDLDYLLEETEYSAFTFEDDTTYEYKEHDVWTEEDVHVYAE